MIFVAILLLGWLSLERLPTNLFPDIKAPRVTVTVRAKGLSPVEVERRICETMERSLYSIRGVTSVESISRADSAVIIVNFDWETRLDYAVLEVKKAASDLQRDRSQDVESTTVIRFDPNARPIITAALQAPENVDLEAVFQTADQTLKPRFERIAGVASVVLSGGMKREILVQLDESRLLVYDLQASTVINALKAENVDGVGGWVEEGARRYLVKAQGRFSSIDQVQRVVVARKADAPVLLQDVARVELVPQEATSLATYAGRPAVGMAFYREAESNTVAVAKAVRDEAEETLKILPKGWKLTVVNDQSRFISGAIREVKENAILGGVLAVVVLLVFLRDVRSTLIISIAIPVSIIATFNLMYFQGLSLNLMSLGGVALGTGMLVDNAIVVLENIFRLRGQGMGEREAAIKGTQEVAAALVASTATTVAVFLPIAYTQGVASTLFKEQALTVSYSLLASLVVALLLIPMLAAWLMRGGSGLGAIAAPPGWPERIYEAILRLSLRLRYPLLGGALLITYLAYLAWPRIAQEFLPPTRVSDVGIRLVLPSGTPIASTEQVTDTVLAQIGRFEPAIEHMYARAGESIGTVSASTDDPDGPNTSDILLALRSSDTPTTAMIEAGLGGFDSNQLVAELQPVLSRIEGARVTFNVSQGSLAELLGTSSAPLLLEISGPDLETLTRLTGEMRARLEDVPQLLNVRTNLLDGSPELRLRLDRTQMARYGMDVNSLATQIRQRLDGEVATQVRGEAGDVDIRVEVDYGRETIETLRSMTIETSAGGIVRLDALAEFQSERGPREIVRRRQERVASVMADLAPGTKLSDGIAAATAALDGVTVPGRYATRFTGEEQERRDAFASLGFALVLSIILVYMVMASIFESFLQPLLIMATVPMAMIGVVFSLLATGQTINVMSMIGIVMLGGIVVNNAIVLLDCVNQLRAEGLDQIQSLIVGCRQRLRPVLMTTLTTLLGLLPMAMSTGEGAELRRAMAITVLGGLATSTVLTLVVIPCGQLVLDGFLRLTRRITSRG
jgi:HAE1 family hydrophobic/amphiphilic exporter-1